MQTWPQSNNLSVIPPDIRKQCQESVGGRSRMKTRQESCPKEMLTCPAAFVMQRVTIRGIDI